jgi:predicted metal-binding membrane protein
MIEVASGQPSTGHQHNSMVDGEAGRMHGVVWMAIMATAMMVPLVLPSLRRLSLTSLWSHRYRAQVLFLLGYLATWAVAAGTISVVVMAAEIRVGRVPTLGIALVGGALWQFAPVKRSALRRCDRTVPIPAHSWRADLDRTSFGAGTAISCVATCWGFMVMLAAVGHGIGAMSSLFVIQMYERIADRYVPAAGVVVLCVLGAVGLATGAA